MPQAIVIGKAILSFLFKKKPVKDLFVLIDKFHKNNLHLKCRFIFHSPCSLDDSRGRFSRFKQYGSLREGLVAGHCMSGC